MQQAELHFITALGKGSRSHKRHVKYLTETRTADMPATSARLFRGWLSSAGLTQGVRLCGLERPLYLSLVNNQDRIRKKSSKGEETPTR